MSSVTGLGLVKLTTEEFRVSVRCTSLLKSLWDNIFNVGEVVATVAHVRLIPRDLYFPENLCVLRVMKMHFSQAK